MKAGIVAPSIAGRFFLFLLLPEEGEIGHCSDVHKFGFPVTLQLKKNTLKMIKYFF